MIDRLQRSLSHAVGTKPPFLTNHRRCQTLAAGRVMKAITSFITEPMAVDRFIDARLKARNSVLIRLDTDIAAGAAAGANRRRFLQIPNPDLEAKIAIGQRADRANVDDVRRQRIIQTAVRKKRNRRMIAAVRPPPIRWF